MDEPKKRFYTTPYGLTCFIVLAIGMAVVNVFALIPNFVDDSMKGYLIIIDTVGPIALLAAIHDKCFNFIVFSHSGMFHKNGTYSWEEIHITAFVRDKSGTSVPTFCFAFSNKFLSFEEARSAYKKGLCLFVTAINLKYFLSVYKKEISIPQESKYVKWKRMIELRQVAARINEHNAAIQGKED